MLRSKYPEKLEELTKGAFGCAPPFVMVSCFKKITGQGKTTYGREYSWGTCDIENPKHCDFLLLYNMLIVIFSKPLIQIAQITQVDYLKWRNKRNCEVTS